MRYLLYTLFLVLLSPISFCQIAGNSTFSFLNLGYSARTVGLGTNFITVIDEDINLGLHTPSLLNKQHHQKVTFNHSILAGGLNYGMFGYAHQLKNKGILSTSIRYMSYGKMDLTLPTGEVIGSFSAGDIVVGAGYGQQINEIITLGFNTNIISSILETYSAYGISGDLSGTFNFEKQRTVVTALVRNMGVQLVGYVSTNREPIQPNAMIGISHKLAHAPFRISIVGHHLQKWDLSYNDPTAIPKKDPLTGEIIPIEQAGFIEKFGRHCVFQVETLLGSSFHLRAAIDINQRLNMQIINRTGLAGFSFGFGLMVKKFQLQYGFNVVSSAGFNNMISLSTNVGEWNKRQRFN
jgi:hypothetical protein